MTEEIKKVVEDFKTMSLDPMFNEFFERDPEHKFFEEFIEYFPTKQGFDDELRDGYDYEDDDEDDDLTQEEMDEKYWSPEHEVYTIQQCVDGFCGEELWVDFWNSLVENNW
jgi:hypothetical protein